MNLFKKRICAYTIDVLICAFILATIFLAFGDIPEWFWGFKIRFGEDPSAVLSLPSVGFFLVLAFLTCIDLPFRNASIGKKLLGLKIVDTSGNPPKIFNLVIRCAIMHIWGMVQYSANRFPSSKYKEWQIDFVDWEERKLHTRVVEARKAIEKRSKTDDASRS